MDRSAYIASLKAHGQRNKIPNISWTGVDLLRFFITTHCPKKVLEMGCANGFSSIVIGDALEVYGGSLITGDISLEAVEEAQKNISYASLCNIEVRYGNILETVSVSDAPFDLVFIDAQKSHTHLFFQFAQKVLNDEGIIIIDDTQKFAHKMQSFYTFFESIKANWHWILVFEEDDALMVLQKKKS